MNIHLEQGITIKDGIIMMSEREWVLNFDASLLVSVNRIAEHATLITDNPERIERQITAECRRKDKRT